MSGEPPAGPSRRRALLLAYDGGAYAGWQVQPDVPTVQGTIEAALARLLREPVRIMGSGRTDAGVHALGQVAHFDDPRGLPPERLRAALNGLLPQDIRVRRAAVVAPGFHALHGACGKTYFYQLHLAAPGAGARAALASLPPLRRATFHAVRGDLDVAAMRAVARALAGTRDFTALSKAMPEGRGTVKTLRAVRVLRIPAGLRIYASADGFLYGMVRMLAGLLVDAGRGRVTPADALALLESRDRSRAPPLLPPHGLFLWRVCYPEGSWPDERPAMLAGRRGKTSTRAPATPSPDESETPRA